MSQKALRHANATRIFHAIRAVPGATQREIVAMADTDKSTVSNVLRRLEEQGLVRREEKASSGGRGRPSEGYVISSQGGVVIGINLRPAEIRLVMANLAGEPLAVLACPMPEDVDALGKAMHAGLKGLMISAGQDESALRAVGITVPGLIETGGLVRHSPNLNLRNFNPRVQLEAEIDTPVFVGNNANSAALAELLLNNPPGERSFLMLICGSGVGAGLVHSGQLYQGGIGFAGEIGHQKVRPGGRQCICGGRGCMDAYVSNTSLLRIAQEAGVPVESFDEIVALAKAGTPALAPLLDDYVQALAMGLGNAISSVGLLDVILTGGVAQLYPFIEKPLDAALREVLHAEIYADLSLSLGAPENTERPLGGVAVALEGCTGLAAVDHAPWSRAANANSLAG